MLNERSGGSGSHKTRNRLVIGGSILAVIIIILLLRSCGGGNGPDNITDIPTPTPGITETPTPGPDDTDDELIYTMTIKGDLRTEVTEGDEFTDLGVEIRDQYGKLYPEKVKEVTIEGEVDTDVPGTYIITYKFGDDVIRRIVVVKEKTEETQEPGSTTNPSTTENPTQPSGNPEDENNGGSTQTPPPSTKQQYDMSGVSFDDMSVVYDGSNHSIHISGNLPEGVRVTYSGNNRVNAGTYTITAHFYGAEDHEPIPNMTAKLTIRKAYYDMSAVDFDDCTVEYDGKYHSIYVDETTLPDGVSVLKYVGNNKKDPGTYTVTVYFTGDSRNYHSIPAMTAKLNIIKKDENKPSYDMSAVSFKDATVTYDGNAHSIFISGKLPTGVSVSYTGNGRINAGVYTVTAHFAGSADYNPIPDMTATLTISKANYDMSGISFKNSTVKYDGKPHSIFISGKLPDGVSVTYEGNGKTAVGTYTVTAKFTGDSNHNPISNMTATLTIHSQSIEKPSYDMSGVTFDDKTVTYDGTVHSLAIGGKALPAGVSVTYENNGKINAGTYKVIAHFTGSADYKPIPDMTAILTINKATYNMSGVSFNNQTVTFDGQPHSIFISGKLPAGVSVTYEGNGKTAVGTYTVTAKFTGDSNHNPISNMTATLIIQSQSIEKPSYDMSGVTFDDDTFTYDGNVHSLAIGGKALPAGVSVTYENNDKTDAGTYKVIAHFTGDADHKPIPDMTATLTINKATYNMSGVSLNNQTVTFDGQPHSIFITGDLPAGVSVTYEGNGQTAVGTYTVTAKFTGDSNHNPISNMTATLTIQSQSIEKPSYDMSGVTFDDDTFTYDGTVHSLAIGGKALPAGVSVTYENNDKTDAGTYTVIAHFTGDADHKPIDDMTATLTINKADVNKGTISFPSSHEILYDGNVHAYPEVSGSLPEGVLGVSYTYGSNDPLQEVGTYSVTAHFEVDDNHNAFSMTCTVVIKEKNAGTDPDNPNPPDVDPENPTEPVNPDEPIVDPENPTEPVNPDEPIVDPENHTEPVNPDEPIVDPENPTEPVNPDEPVVDPENPTEPVNPDEPNIDPALAQSDMQAIFVATPADALPAETRRKDEEEHSIIEKRVESMKLPEGGEEDNPL